MELVVIGWILNVQAYALLEVKRSYFGVDFDFKRVIPCLLIPFFMFFGVIMDEIY